MQPRQGGLTGKRVLIVEDEYLLAEDLRRYLAGQGIAVIGPMPSVAQALSAIDADGELHFALLDIKLRDNQLVYPVAERLISRKIPFAFATGFDRSALPDRYRD